MRWVLVWALNLKMTTLANTQWKKKEKKSIGVFYFLHSEGPKYSDGIWFLWNYCIRRRAPCVNCWQNGRWQSGTDKMKLLCVCIDIFGWLCPHNLTFNNAFGVSVSVRVTCKGCSLLFLFDFRRVHFYFDFFMFSLPIFICHITILRCDCLCEPAFFSHFPSISVCISL